MRRATSTVSILVASAFVAGTALGATRKVGPGQAYAKPCAAFAAADDGDTVEIDAAGNGTYDGDVCVVSANRLAIRGINGRARVDAAGKNSQGKGIWVIAGNDATVENVELSGAQVPDHNGAGIRAEGTNLTVRNCYFHDDEDGILGGAGEVLVEFSEFAKNGNCIDPAGCAHNLYINGATTKFTLQYSYSHSVTDGHLVKSRAKENYILYNRLTGEAGTDSYELSMPNAGTSYVIGNLIEQGQNTGNPTMLDYGSEGASNPGGDLYVINNTFVNDHAAGGIFVSTSGVSVPAIIKNNIFVGPGTLVSQATAVLANNYSSGDPLLVDPSTYDYHLRVGSPCVDAGTDPKISPVGFSLLPTEQYVHVAGRESRVSVGIIDIGAYELGGGDPGAGGGTSSGNGGTSTSGGGGGVGGAASGDGGVQATGGKVGVSLAGGGAQQGPSSNTGGCGCRAACRQPTRTGSLSASLAAAFMATVRRRRRQLIRRNALE